MTGDGATLDIDGNGEVEALTDGLLALRSLFGFTGATLVDGAVDVGCSRCTDDLVEIYLGFDREPARHRRQRRARAPHATGSSSCAILFGFTGTALTTGAVGQPCGRCDAAAIEPYLTGLAN